MNEIITQNIDGLHQAAGAQDVIEMHGNLKVCICLQCHRQFSSDLLEVDVTTEAEIPRCPQCRGALKPGVILFEEALPADAIDRAIAAAHKADLFIVIGSSLEVGPVNQLPAMAAMQGAALAIVNLEPTHLDRQAQWIIRERAAQVVDNCCRYLAVAIPRVEF